MEINSKAIKEKWLNDLLEEISKLRVIPKLVIIQVGSDPASNSYIRSKINIGTKLGIDVVHINVEETISQEELENIIKKNNEDTTVTGIILQSPIPKHLNEKECIKHISLEKDVDGFTLEQMGKLVIGDKDCLIPCTALGVLRLLKETVGDLTGKRVCIINRSTLIGKPLFSLLLKENATPIICHTKTNNLEEEIKRSDIIITGCGKRALFNSNHFREGQVIIDCSMYIGEDGKVGDCDKEDILQNIPNILISSGRGHTGPLTVCGLMHNTIEVQKRKEKI